MIQMPRQELIDLLRKDSAEFADAFDASVTRYRSAMAEFIVRAVEVCRVSLHDVATFIENHPFSPDGKGNDRVVNELGKIGKIHVEPPVAPPAIFGLEAIERVLTMAEKCGDVTIEIEDSFIDGVRSRSTPMWRALDQFNEKLDQMVDALDKDL